MLIAFFKAQLLAISLFNKIILNYPYNILFLVYIENYLLNLNQRYLPRKCTKSSLFFFTLYSKTQDVIFTLYSKTQNDVVI